MNEIFVLVILGMFDRDKSTDGCFIREVAVKLKEMLSKEEYLVMYPNDHESVAFQLVQLLGGGNIVWDRGFKISPQGRMRLQREKFVEFTLAAMKPAPQTT